MMEHDSENMNVIDASQQNWSDKIHLYKNKLSQNKRVIHHITNFVTMYQCARITSFTGAAPIMAFAHEESAAVLSHSDALVVNTGTLNDEVIRAIPKALDYANSHHIPVVLDPVGAKLSDYRYEFICSLIDHYHFDVIRCNSVELLNLHGEAALSKGIDGVATSSDILAAVMETARKYDCVIACTGPMDYVSDGKTCISLKRGSALLPKLVGTGCMVNSIIASYLPVADTPVDAAAAGVMTMCLAGEMAEARLSDTAMLGSFETYLMDGICML